MIITFEEYNKVVNGLRQQLLLHSQRERELLDYIKHREEMLDAKFKRIEELVNTVDELGQKLSKAITDNLELVSTNMKLFNDLEKAREENKLTYERATRIEQQLANLKLKLRGRKE